MEAVVIVALVIYAIYRVIQFRKYRKYDVVPRIQVEELEARLASDQKDRVLIADVRSHGYYNVGAERITGPFASSPITWTKRLKTFPKIRTFICTALERAKRPAPGWRIYCGKKDSTRS